MTDSIFFLLMRIMAILGFVFVIAAGILYAHDGINARRVKLDM